MSKPSKVSALVLGLLGVIGMITVFSFNYAWSADKRVTEVKETVTAHIEQVDDRVIVNEVKVNGLKDDIQELKGQIQNMKTAIENKLDVIINRGSH